MVNIHFAKVFACVARTFAKVNYQHFWFYQHYSLPLHSIKHLSPINLLPFTL